MNCEDCIEKIAWDLKFSTGIDLIDEQHQEIIHMINQLIPPLAEEVPSEKVPEVVSRMLTYAQVHFTTEEQLMEEYEYQNYQIHKALHSEFRKKTAHFSIDCMKNSNAIPIDLLTYLQNWWRNHILKHDISYKDFFDQKI